MVANRGVLLRTVTKSWPSVIDRAYLIREDIAAYFTRTTGIAGALLKENMKNCPRHVRVAHCFGTLLEVSNGMRLLSRRYTRNVASRSTGLII